MLPKFLFADNSQDSPDRIYVFHTQVPKCIFECGIDDDFFDSHNIHWFDKVPEDETEVKELIALAEQFLDDELENQEKLYDMDDDE